MLKIWVECKKSGTVNCLWEKTKSSTEYNNGILRNSYTVNGKNAMIAPLRMPLCKIQKSMVVWFLLAQPVANLAVTNKSVKPVKQRMAWDVLMNSSRECQPMQLKEVKNKKHELYNDIIILLDCQFTTQDMPHGIKLIQCLTECFWAIETRHTTFSTESAQGHCQKLPVYFKSIYMKGYRDWAAQKHARPTLTKDSLMKCSDNLYDTISFWDRKAFDPKLLNECRMLAESWLRVGFAPMPIIWYLPTNVSKQLGKQKLWILIQEKHMKCQ